MAAAPCLDREAAVWRRRRVLAERLTLWRQCRVSAGDCALAAPPCFCRGLPQPYAAGFFSGIPASVRLNSKANRQAVKVTARASATGSAV